MPALARVLRNPYDSSHQKMRAYWTPIVKAGHAECAEPVCVYRSRWIPPTAAWDLAHDRTTGLYRGPAHRRCNRAEGARWGNRLRRHRPPPPAWRSRAW
jgi:hypothetical protein